MNMDFVSFACLVLVGFLWGATNPFLKRADGVKSGIIPVAVNQMGSILFYLSLSSSDLSLVGPLANGFSFLFTGVVGALYFKEPLSAKNVIGSIFVLTGLILCTLSKQQ